MNTFVPFCTVINAGIHAKSDIRNKSDLTKTDKVF